MSSNDAASNGSDELGAILTYHILRGVHAELLLKGPPQFIPTLLTNQSFTNVTGGQRVEAAASDDGVIFYSAVKAISKLISPVRQLARRISAFALTAKLRTFYTRAA
jgi:hypothetical protein